MRVRVSRVAAPEPARPWRSRQELILHWDAIEKALATGGTRAGIWRDLYNRGLVQTSYAGFCKRLRAMQSQATPRRRPTPPQASPSRIQSAPPVVPSASPLPSETLGRSFRPNPTPDIDDLV